MFLSAEYWLLKELRQEWNYKYLLQNLGYNTSVVMLRHIARGLTVQKCCHSASTQHAQHKQLRGSTCASFPCYENTPSTQNSIHDCPLFICQRSPGLCLCFRGRGWCRRSGRSRLKTWWSELIASSRLQKIIRISPWFKALRKSSFHTTNTTPMMWHGWLGQCNTPTCRIHSRC